MGGKVVFFRISKFIVNALGVLALICLTMSLILHFLGVSTLEWTDAQGCGNGIAHSIDDGRGWPVAYFRLSNFSSVDRTYKLEIKPTYIYSLSENIKATRFDEKGRRMAEDEFKAVYKDKAGIMMVEMQDGFTPRTDGETLVLEFTAISKEGDSRKFQIRFVSQTFHYPLSV